MIMYDYEKIEYYRYSLAILPSHGWAAMGPAPRSFLYPFLPVTTYISYILQAPQRLHHSRLGRRRELIGRCVNNYNLYVQWVAGNNIAVPTDRFPSIIAKTDVQYVPRSTTILPASIVYPSL